MESESAPESETLTDSQEKPSSIPDAPDNSFTAVVLLADYACVSEGKLTVVGGGWTTLYDPGHPTSIALIINVPWNETNKLHKWKLSLLTGDGESVCIDTPLGKLPIKVDGEFEGGRPLGSRPGQTISAKLGLQLGPLPLEFGKDYVWEFAINGQSRKEWTVPFDVKKKPAH